MAAVGVAACGGVRVLIGLRGQNWKNQRNWWSRRQQRLQQQRLRLLLSQPLGDRARNCDALRRRLQRQVFVETVDVDGVAVDFDGADDGVDCCLTSVVVVVAAEGDDDAGVGVEDGG